MSSRREPFCRVGEHGFTLTVKTNFTPDSITGAVMHLRDPGGVVTDKACDDNTLSAGEFGWVTTDGFFDEVGWWTVAVTVTHSGGVRKTVRETPFFVGADLTS